MISIKNVHKQFGSQVVLNDVSMEIKEGKTTVILGPSGTGKSVLLKIISGLLTADSGEVTIGEDSMTGASSAEERRLICARMGVLFQSAALFDSMSLFDNVAFPLRQRGGINREEIKERSLARIEEVGMRGFENKLPGEVSIGMRKRIGIARAMVTEPEIILFDEPNTGLDPQVGQEIYELIVETQKNSNSTGIVVSHEIPEVFQVCDRVVMLYQGSVQFDGEVEEFMSSPKEVVTQFRNGDSEGPIEMV